MLFERSSDANSAHDKLTNRKIGKTSYPILQ